MAWSATLTATEKRAGMVFAYVTFTESATGEVVERTFNGDNLTAAHLTRLATGVVRSLEERDAAFATLTPGPIRPKSGSLSNPPANLPQKTWSWII